MLGLGPLTQERRQVRWEELVLALEPSGEREAVSLPGKGFVNDNDALLSWAGIKPEFSFCLGWEAWRALGGERSVDFGPLGA